MKLADAIQALATTYQSLDMVASSLIVDAAEVHNALNTAQAGSMEELCLGYLAKYNPYIPPKKKESKTEE